METEKIRLLTEFIRKYYLFERGTYKFADMDIKTMFDMRNDFYFKYENLLNNVIEDVLRSVKSLKEEELQKMKDDFMNEIQKIPKQF